MIKLRDYQQKGVAEIRERFAAGIKRVLYVLSTGAGKTVTFSYIAAGVAANGKRVTIIAHREELLDQISAALDAAGVPHGVLRGGTRGLPRSNVLVASVFTLVKRIDHFIPPDLLITDESHHASAGSSWMKVAQKCRQSFQLGVTATPCRLDGHGLDDAFDTMVVGPSLGDLTEMGFLVPAEVYAPPVAVDMSGIRRRGGDFAIGEAAERMDKPRITGNAVEHYRRLADGKAAVVFCCSIAHAEAVAQQFRMEGYRATSIDGKMDKGDRKDAIEGLRTRKVQVLTSCDVISEGLDIPLIEVGILLRPTESLSLYLQQVGRCLRPAPAKRAAIILDHVGNSLRHGLPDEPRQWSLAGRPDAETKSKVQPLKTCPKCLAIHPPRPDCPRCGHVYVVTGRQLEEVEGELERITPEMREQARVDARREVEQARDRAALEKIAKARKYNRKWVDYVLAARSKNKTNGAIHETSSDQQLLGLEPT